MHCRTSHWFCTQDWHAELLDAVVIPGGCDPGAQEGPLKGKALLPPLLPPLPLPLPLPPPPHAAAVTATTNHV
jgi:hypothetical protein